MENLDKNLMLFLLVSFLIILFIFFFQGKLSKEIDKTFQEKIEGKKLLFKPEEIGGGIESAVPQPRELKVEALENIIILKWSKPEAENIEHYKIYRMELRGQEQNWKLLAQRETNEKEWHEFQDNTVASNVIYTYGVVVVDTKGNESDLLESYPINLKSK